MNRRVVIMSLVSLMLASPFLFAEKNGRFIPTSAPVSIAPMASGEEYFGFGSDLITMEIDWDDFYLSLPGEHEGNIEVKINDFSVGMFRAVSDKSILEADLAFGKITSSSSDAQYDPGIMGALVRLKIDGSGMNAGARIVYSHTIASQTRASGAKFIDWNLAYSLHAAYFTMENKALLTSISNVEIPNMIPEGYNVPALSSLSDLGYFGEKQSGIFLRPLVALQPIIHTGERITWFPFVGVGTKETWTKYEWLDNSTADEYGVNDYLPAHQNDTKFENWGVNMVAGFDVGVLVNKRLGHEISLGSAINRVSGEEDSDFMEYHALYRIPFGKN